MPYADPEKQKEAKRKHAKAKYQRDKAHREEKKAAVAARYQEKRKDKAWMEKRWRAAARSRKKRRLMDAGK